jgi:hypothetical protein
MMNSRISNLMMGVLAAALLTACGGGGSGSTGVTGTPANTVVTAQAATTSVFQGPVAGLGSVIVNGVRFSVVGANLSDDDSKSLTSADLQIGMQVKVSGSSDQQLLTGSANSVELAHGTRGPITTLNTVLNELTLMGQRVVFNANTAYRGVTGLAGLVIGDLVEVHGIAQADGSVVATLIEKKTVSVFSVRGAVSALNTSAKTFSVGSLLVDYSSTVVQGTLVNGALVKIRSATPPVSARLTPTTVDVINATQAYTTNNTLKLKGAVSALPAAGRLTLEGTTVDTSAVALLGGTAVKVGDVIEVRGVWDGSTLKATQIEFNGYREAQAGYSNELYGNISTYTSLANFVVNGVTVDASALTGLTAALLPAGTYVEIKGAMQGAVLKASKVEIKTLTTTTTSNASTPESVSSSKTGDTDNNDAKQVVSVSGGYYETYGTVSAYVSAADFKVNGVRVNAISAVIDHPERGPLRNGSFVELKGSQNASGVFVASKLEIK